MRTGWIIQRRAGVLLVCALTLGFALQSQTAAQQPALKDARRAAEQGAQAAADGRIDDAFQHYLRAVKLDPRFAEAWCALGELQLRRKDPAAARDSFSRAIEADPLYLKPYLPLATLEQDAGDWQQLADVTRRWLQIDNVDFPQAYLLHSVANYNLRKLDIAESSAREAERLDPQHKIADTWRLLGLILGLREDYAGAAAQFREYLRLAPNGPSAEAVRAKLADAEARSGTIAPAAMPSATFRAETKLALVSFTAISKKRELIRDLTPEDIEIREDGVPQKIAVLEGGAGRTHSAPIEVSLLFDCSFSVRMSTAASPKVFQEGLLGEFPNVSIAVYGFSDYLVRATRPTRDASALKKAADSILTIAPRDTPLFGAVADAARDAGSTDPSVIRIMVILSDGESYWPGDKQRKDEAIRVAREFGMALYPVLLIKSGENGTAKAATAPGQIRSSAADSVDEFTDLARATGGQALQVFMDADVLPAVLKSIGREIRGVYVTGYYPASSSEPKRHNIEVIFRSKERGQIYGGGRTVVY